MPAFTPTRTPQAPNTFDLVKQFDAMRSGDAGAPMSTAAYRPAAAPEAHSDGDGHNHGSDGGLGAGYNYGDVQMSGGSMNRSYTPSGKLVNYGGYQFDEGFAPFVQDITSKFGGLKIGSGYRDPARNSAAGGVKGSHHLTGNAVDLSGSAGDMQRGAAYAQSKGYRVLIHNAGSGMHLHISR